MMTQLDEASDKIPEGLYLKFCDHLKNLHTCQPTQVVLQRPSAPRRCGRCHQVGHNRRGCRYHEADHHALDSAYRNGQTPAEAGIEKNPVVIIYYSVGGVAWSLANGGKIEITIYMPEVEDIVDIPAGYATFQGRRDLHIKIPGKYKAEISLPAKTDKVVSHTWNPIRHILTVTLQMVPMQKLVKSSNTLND
tara:strand:+ start:79 stop:654 length:576 start_codon:yes stop_codon:yes gene_type:complete